MGRSGSHLLSDLLSSLPGVHCDDEIFNPDTWRHGIHRRMLPYFQRYPMQLIAFKRNAALFQRFASSYGFMLKLGQLDRIHQPSGLLHRLLTDDWRIILLFRQSVFDQTVSAFMAQRSRRWQSMIHEPDADVGNIRIDPDEFIRLYRIRQNMKLRCHELVADLPHLSLSYENDLQSSGKWQETINRVCGHLGIEAPAFKVKSSLRKTWRQPYRELIENHDELLELVRELGEPI